MAIIILIDASKDMLVTRFFSSCITLLYLLRKRKQKMKKKNVVPTINSIFDFAIAVTAPVIADFVVAAAAAVATTTDTTIAFHFF